MPARQHGVPPLVSAHELPLGYGSMPDAAGRDAEISAIETVIAALEPLDDDARGRVLDYTFRRLRLRELPTTPADLSGGGFPAAPGPAPSDREPQETRTIVDIRSLRDQKQPSSANEMAALAAYYAAELAPDNERNDTISSAEVERLFKQANFKLPARTAMTLPNAAAAGYFDKAGSGRWKLNPVGHNLVTQTLPRTGESTRTAAPRKRAARGARASKAASKKATGAKSNKTASKKNRAK